MFVSEIFSRLKFPEHNIFLLEALFIHKIKLLDPCWNGLISHKNVMHYYVFGLTNFMRKLLINELS